MLYQEELFEKHKVQNEMQNKVQKLEIENVIQ